MEPLKGMGIFLLLIMFALSGASKLIKIGNTQTKQFTDVFKLPHAAAQALVFLGGLIEVVAVVMILVGEFKNNKQTTRHGIAGLILFTVAATLLFKIYPKFKKIQLLANMSVLGGLILYYDCRR